MIRITKQIEFCASHQLKLPYDSPCNRLHGHTYKMIITLERSGPFGSNGMVYDFHKIKQYVKEHLDHRDLNDFMGEKNPTVENLIVQIAKHMRQVLHFGNISIVYLRLYESPTSYAEYFPNLGNGLDTEVILTKSDCSRENLSNAICKDCTAPTGEYCEGCSEVDSVEPNVEECSHCGTKVEKWYEDKSEECETCGHAEDDSPQPVGFPIHLPFVEMVKTVQGEGYNAGAPVYLIRLAGCNLSCDYCDTDHKGMGTMDMRAYIGTKASKGFFEHTYPIFLITGGEPTIHDTTKLVHYLRERFPHCQVWLESNGTGKAEQYQEFDYVTISPKLSNNRSEYVDKLKYNLRFADEIRVVAYENTIESRGRLRNLDSELAKITKFQHLYLSPLALGANEAKPKGTSITKERYDTCLELLNYIRLSSDRKHMWRLSLQMHKLMGIQ